MMTTPRVTEIPIEMAPVEPDPFIDPGPRATAAKRRLSERQAEQRRTELVRHLIRMRAQRQRG